MRRKLSIKLSLAFGRRKVLVSVCLLCVILSPHSNKICVTQLSALLRIRRARFDHQRIEKTFLACSSAQFGFGIIIVHLAHTWGLSAYILSHRIKRRGKKTFLWRREEKKKTKQIVKKIETYNEEKFAGFFRFNNFRWETFNFLPCFATEIEFMTESLRSRWWRDTEILIILTT